MRLPLNYPYASAYMRLIETNATRRYRRYRHLSHRCILVRAFSQYYSMYSQVDAFKILYHIEPNFQGRQERCFELHARIWFEFGA